MKPTLQDIQELSAEELHDLTLMCVRWYGCRVSAKWKDIKAFVDIFAYHERSIEEALEALQREDQQHTLA
jgi:ribosome-binding factor A